MNKTILELVFDCVCDCGISAGKMISKFLGLNWNEHDFKKFFSAVSLCNKECEYPKLEKIKNENFYKVYTFNIPLGLTLDDFNKTIKQMSYFMKLGEPSLSYSLTDNLENIELKVFKFDEYFRQLKLHNENEVHPKFKNFFKEDNCDIYVFSNPREMKLEDFIGVLDKISDYFKLNKEKVEFSYRDENNLEVELRVFT